MTRAARLLLLLSPFVLWGCAFTDHEVQLPRTGGSARVFEGKGRPIAVVGPFSDKRAIADRVGMKKNGYGIETASVRCAGNPAAWVEERLIAGLQASGFTVLTGDLASQVSGAVRIEGELVKLFGEAVVGYYTSNVETDVHVRLIATLPSGRRAERIVYVKGISPSSANLLYFAAAPMSDGDFDESLRDATQRLMSELVRSISELLDRDPTLEASVTAAEAPAGTERRRP